MIPRLPLVHLLCHSKTPIVVLNGLPGSGKSEVIKQLARYHGQSVSHSLPIPQEHSQGGELFWDPSGNAFKQHLQLVVELLPELEERQQTLYMTSCWIETTSWLSAAFLYQKVTIVEQQHLMMSAHEISQCYPQADSDDILQQTAGVPILVANWDRISDERFQNSWLEFVHSRLLPLLPFNEQRLLIALAHCSSIAQRALNFQLTNIDVLSPLIRLNHNGDLTLGVPYLRRTLRSIAQKELRLYQNAMRIVSKQHHANGQRLASIQTAVASNNLDLALRWFRENGSGMYGFYHGFDELDKVLALFPTVMLSQELHLAWAKIISLNKSHRTLEAKSFIDNLPQHHHQTFGNEQDDGIAMLIRSKHYSYLSSDILTSQVQQLAKLESTLATHPGALMSYYSMMSIRYANEGEWFQSVVFQNKELQLAQHHDIPYLVFYCHFNIARFNLRMGYIPKAAQHIDAAELALKRVSFLPSLTYERNFGDLAHGMTALMSADIQQAHYLWHKVMVLRHHSEVWPEFLTQFHLFGMLTTLLSADIDSAYELHDELRYEYQACFSDQSDNSFYAMMMVLILQQQQRWVDAQRHLQTINHKSEAVRGVFKELYEWIKLRNQTGLICIHHHKRGHSQLQRQYHEYPWMEMSCQLQEIKLLWHKRDTTCMAMLADVLIRCERLNLWLPVVLENEWINSAIHTLWHKEKQRYSRTQLAKAIERWQQLQKSLISDTLPDAISYKQLQVLQRLAEGLSNKQIAQYCGISESTVKFHLKNMFKDHGVKNRQNLVALAQSKGWIK